MFKEYINKNRRDFMLQSRAMHMCALLLLIGSQSAVLGSMVAVFSMVWAVNLGVSIRPEPGRIDPVDVNYLVSSLRDDLFDGQSRDICPSPLQV